jgi:beta-glucosidase
MKKIFRYTLLGVCLNLSMVAFAKQVLPYKDKSLPIETRVHDLLNRMTMQEKVGQLLCTLGWDYYVINKNDVSVSEKFIKELDEKQMGMAWATFRADPWTRKTLADGLNPELAAKCSNALQRYVLNHTRLGIPLFFAEEAPHGHMAIGTTVFPTGLGLAATWSTELAQQMGKVIAHEIRLQGGHISYGPVLDLARDPRWSRVEETLGEDPMLSGAIGAAEVSGLTNSDLSKPFSTLATLKHFIAYGAPEGGQNGAQSVVGECELQDCFLPPFRKVINSGALSVMTSYNSIDGIPSTCNAHLLTDVLRKQWHFNGFVVSDLYSIDGICGSQRVAPTLLDAGVKALKAGVDVDLGANAFSSLCDAVQKGLVEESVIDTAVVRVLRMKMQMGLFDNPFVDPKAAAKEVRSAESIHLARLIARASVTLLKNDKGILPLKHDVKVAVIGPNADNRYNMLGDYTAPQEPSNVKTLLDGVRSKIPSENVEYVKGCAIRDTSDNSIAAAVDAARRADVVIVAVGGSSARDFKTNYKETGAAIADSHTISDMECGEGFDRASLQLLGLQNRLLEALKTTGKPMVVVYIEGRPLDMNWSADNADALLTAYYPGQEGGNAIADVLFGDYNPAGRLPVTVPRNVGQLPVYYNHRRPSTHDYVEMSAQPLYPFGFGLSYSRFEYSNLKVEKNQDNTYSVSFDVLNSGERDGEEVPQLYLSTEFASTVQPLLQLKHFTRVPISKGATRHIEFILTADDFALTGADMVRKVEAGTYDILIGASSADIRLRSKITLN